MIQRAVIFAVGHPQHKSQLAYNRPRAMLPALGKPLVVRTMNRLLNFGIKHFITVVGENEGAVAAYLNSTWVPNAKVEFILKTNYESVAQVLARIVRQDNSPFIIASYNSFTHSQFPETLLKYHNDNPKSLILSGAQMSLSKSPQRYYAIMEGQRVKEITSDKPTDKRAPALANLVICGADFIEHLSTIQGTGSFHKQLMDIIQEYIRAQGEAILVESAWTLQIETDADLLTLSKHLLDEGQDAHILSELPYTVQVVPPVRIDPQVSVGQGAKIGPYVYLEKGCSVGHEAVVQNAMVLQQATVPAKAKISGVIASTIGMISD